MMKSSMRKARPPDLNLRMPPHNPPPRHHRRSRTPTSAAPLSTTTQQQSQAPPVAPMTAQPHKVPPLIPVSQAQMEKHKPHEEEKDGVNCVDYRVPHASRPLEVKIAGKSLFVNPEFLKDVSPMLTSFLVREMVAGKRKTVETQLETLNYDEVLEALKVICPTEHSLLPCPVKKENFATFARMSRQFKVPKLREACEVFAAQLRFHPSVVSCDELVVFVDAAFRYGLKLSAKVRLLEGLLGMPSTTGAQAINVVPEMRTLIERAFGSYADGRFAHASLLDEARLKVPCRVCRKEQLTFQPSTSPTSTPPIASPFVVCSRCRHTICADCIGKPCAALVEQFLVNYTKNGRT
ncbi:hypothetical protein AAVH_08198 [Aphelenchoides avenae]|nr:hypothetical protein AAVH_08198 [Aphelenchus avenae]